VSAVLFPLGRLVATPGALALLTNAGENPAALLDRHVSGDWGDVLPEDSRENDLSVRKGFRIVSSYPVDTRRVWIITEWDRSSTCILLPEEY
jgi:hypothetical protein